jgi:hypothetical protein
MTSGRPHVTRLDSPYHANLESLHRVGRLRLQVLLIVAATHLDAVAFQIFSQSFKLVPTAFFAYWLLGQHLDPIQWASIPVLAAGVILVTINNGASGGAAAAALAARRAEAAAAAGEEGGVLEHLGWLVGMVTCSISGLSSAYAGGCAWQAGWGLAAAHPTWPGKCEGQPTRCWAHCGVSGQGPQEQQAS